MSRRFVLHVNTNLYLKFRLQKPTIENLDQAEEEFTLARLYTSKLKTEARSISNVSYYFSVRLLIEIFLLDFFSV